jgi:anti-sigma factor RsiW
MVHENMTHQDIREQLPDYVLGLLAPCQAEQIADHLAGCAACRDAVLGEREVGALVRSTLNATTRPDAVRLRQLMPPAPRHKLTNRGSGTWTIRMAPVLVVVAFILGSFLISAPDPERPMSLFGGVTATATSTNTPTATIARHSRDADEQTAAGAEDSSLAIPVSVIESPVPDAPPAPLLSPTPIVASSQIAAN